MIKRSSRFHNEWLIKLKALSDENRIQIINELLKNELSVSQLANILRLKIYNISKHLKILEISGLVSQRKKGNFRMYRIATDNKSYLNGNEYVLDIGFCKITF